MKFHLCFLVLFLIITTSSARKLAPDEAAGEISNNKSVEQTLENTAASSFTNLMGMEICGNEEEEECLKRRAVAETHLDYIYTQHQKP